MDANNLYPKPHPQTAGRVIDGEAILMLADDSEIQVLNQVGSRIFELADGSRSVSEIAQLIAGEYQVDEAQAQQDTLAFLRQLVIQNVMVFEHKT
jgi:hypothetical protein